MLWRDIGYLLKDEEKLDDLRKPYKVTTEIEVFCNKKSVRQSEFYQAQAQGYKPELMFVVRSSEYNGEAYFKHEGITYRILRTYDKNGEKTELICSALVNENAEP